MKGITEYRFKVGDRVDAIGGNIFRNGIIKRIYAEEVNGITRIICNVVFDGHLWQKRSINSLEPAKEFHP